jgi:hypothetical protein
MNSISDLNSIQQNVNSNSIDVLNTQNDRSVSIEESNRSKKTLSLNIGLKINCLSLLKQIISLKMN